MKTFLKTVRQASLVYELRLPSVGKLMYCGGDGVRLSFQKSDGFVETALLALLVENKRRDMRE